MNSLGIYRLLGIRFIKSMSLNNLDCSKKCTNSFRSYELRNSFSHNCEVKFEDTVKLTKWKWIHFETLLCKFGFAIHSVSFRYFTLVLDIDWSLPSPNRLRNIKKKNM